MKGVFKKIITFITGFWHDAKTVIKEYALKSVAIVNGIKNVVDSGVTSTIVDLTPFNWDDIALEIVKKWIPKVLVALELAGSLTEDATIEDQLNALVEFLKTASPDLADAIYLKLSSLLTKYQIEDDGVGGKFSQSDLDLIVQLGYNAWKEAQMPK